jgi:hypothetical protein
MRHPFFISTKILRLGALQDFVVAFMHTKRGANVAGTFGPMTLPSMASETRATGPPAAKLSGINQISVRIFASVPDEDL